MLTDNPLAQNFKLRVGKIDIIVPSVPPRDDYIIVLFGDSGNSSPAFAITRITGGSNFTASTGTEHPTTRPSSSSATSSVPTPITEPIPITGTTITGGESTPSNEPTTTAESSSDASQTTTTPSPTQSGPTSTQAGTSTAVGAGTAAPATTSNAALGLSRMGSISTAGLAPLAFTFLLYI
ncbi:hypothetical protein DXG03_003276 [Asterophora parasitica]|uniref:Uncharacterized protein n=1 Tax=Asterophora parasitica TaxID=117018 RepID=A0A9P7G9R8_9AGAR|nr:hypothetical protein DXG03_003276 [Asterophora parasitica]